MPSFLIAKIKKNPEVWEAINEDFNKAISDEQVRKLYEAMKTLNNK